MKVVLNKNQLILISEFCGDVAKGLMLAGILGQGIETNSEPIVKITLSLSLVFLSLIFLRFGIELRKARLRK